MYIKISIYFYFCSANNGNMKTDLTTIHATLSPEKNLNSKTTENTQIHIAIKTFAHLKKRTLMRELHPTPERVIKSLFRTGDFDLMTKPVKRSQSHNFSNDILFRFRLEIHLFSAIYQFQLTPR